MMELGRDRTEDESYYGGRDEVEQRDDERDQCFREDEPRARGTAGEERDDRAPGELGASETGRDDEQREDTGAGQEVDAVRDGSRQGHEIREKIRGHLLAWCGREGNEGEGDQEKTESGHDGEQDTERDPGHRPSRRFEPFRGDERTHAVILRYRSRVSSTKAVTRSPSSGRNSRR
jgi:hypothetical protein